MPDTNLCFNRFLDRSPRFIPRIWDSISRSFKDDDQKSPPSERHSYGAAALLSQLSQEVPIHEPPLQRPEPSSESGLSTDEMPLKRPVLSALDIDFVDIVATIAVDVSGSTAGNVLSKEKEVIDTLCNGLRPTALEKVDVVPWSHWVQPLIKANTLDLLISDGGTKPSTLLSTSASNQALSKCSAWFLLTDGEIDDDEIQNFSQGITQNGLHGIACVIILFGYKSIRPVDCNISVGLSIFSTASDCLFIFHDIDSNKAYILQSKGHFNALLPGGCNELLLNNTTLWGHLPQFSYSSLFQLRIPAPRKLEVDDVRLQNKKTVNLDDIYHNRIDAATATEIMENDDNLKTVLLTAQLRGRDADVRRWISGQAIQHVDALHTPRPDIDSRASETMLMLLDALRIGESPDVLGNLRKALRSAHAANWLEFVGRVAAAKAKIAQRETIVDDALSRIDNNRKLMSQGLHSPSLIAPVSPTPGSMQIIGSSFAPSPAPSENSAPPFNSRGYTMLARTGKRYYNTNRRLETDILYIFGYRYQHSTRQAFYRTCSLCQEPDSVIALLLKECPTEFRTPGFPRQGSRAQLAYPFAMGTFPETDIVSSTVCCDACAHTLVINKLSLDGEIFIEAIPLIPEAFGGPFSDKALSSVDAAFQQRFAEGANESIFLSVLYSTLDNITEEADVEDEKSALQWAISKLIKKISVHMSLGIGSPASTQLGGEDLILPLEAALINSLMSISSTEPNILRYPIGGFVVLIKAMAYSHSNSLANARQNAVWQRFLFHLVETHLSFMRVQQAPSKSILKDLLSDLKSPEGISALQSSSDSPNVASISTPTSNEEESQSNNNTHEKLRNHLSRRKPITVEELIQTHLLSEEDLSTFERLGPLFATIKKRDSFALNVFLQRLAAHLDLAPLETSGSPKDGDSSVVEAAVPADAMDVYRELRAQEGMADVIHKPDVVDEPCNASV